MQLQPAENRQPQFPNSPKALRKNPFERHLTKEDRLHVAVCDYLDLQYPNIPYTHPHNEGKRTKFERYKAKKLRMKPGIPDLLIFRANGDELGFPLHIGLAIELKIRPNRPTENQKKWLKDLASNGWQCHVIYDFDQAKKVIDDYLKTR